MADPVEVLDFWLGVVGPDGWYAGGDEIDALCSSYADVWQAARAGHLDHWIDGTVGTLAFLILTDQLPRNMFRGQADAFATDAQKQSQWAAFLRRNRLAAPAQESSKPAAIE